MDEEHLQPDSDSLPNQSGKRADNGGDDRLSALPNEILFVILSLLPVRRAASTTLLSSRWLDLWKQIPNLKFNLESDRISQMPDQIISLILSKLPLKKAAATCALSSRWSDSWKHTSILNFDRHIVQIFNRYDSRMDVRKYMAMVNSILQSHKAISLKQFRISLCWVDRSAKWAVAKWLKKCLEFVFLRKVESFELECWVSGGDKVVLGELLREIYGSPRTIIFFESLKSLELVYLEVSGEDIELFLRNCLLLELLRIRDLSLTSDIDVCVPSMKRLEICKCSGGKSIKISAPNLTVIRFDDKVGKLFFKNVPRLVEATFDIRTSEFVMHHFVFTTSSHMSQLQFLDIRLSHPKPFWKIAFPLMPNLKKLSIASFTAAHNQSLLQLTRLIWASPHLEEFTLKFFYSCEEPTANMQEIGNVGRSPHQHLKVFHLHLPYGQRVDDHVVKLVTYVSNNCITLRRIDIVCRHVPDYLTRHLQSQVPKDIQLSIRPEL